MDLFVSETTNCKWKHVATFIQYDSDVLKKNILIFMDDTKSVDDVMIW